jgi:transcriptional regulator with XRE-family HTH domain
MSLGHRIKELRKNYGISQQKLAEMLHVSRPTISQIENEERKIVAEELMKLAKVFNLSVDALLGIKKEPEIVLQREKMKKKDEPEIRINVPQRNLEKFKEVLLYILNKVGSKPNIGETVIYKILYFIDFDYYERYEEQLIGATYKKNHHGPTPLEFKKIVERMIRSKEIEKVESKYFNYPQTKYLPLRKPNLDVLKANEKELIDDVLTRLSNLNGSQISDYSHNDVPWLTTEDGGIIEYESVFYRTSSYSMRNNDDNI